MPSPDALKKELYRRLAPTFPGSEILDTMDHAERLMAEYGISIDDELGMERVIGEAVEITLAEFEGEEEDE
jgi:hypothetical protein